jgi:hypothetical protein
MTVRLPNPLHRLHQRLPHDLPSASNEHHHPIVPTDVPHHPTRLPQTRQGVLDVDDVHAAATSGEVRVVGGEGEGGVVAHVGGRGDEVGDGDGEGGDGLLGRV